MRIFVTGATDGQLARALSEAAPASAGVELSFGAPPGFDLTRPASVREPILAFRPHLVVSAAAFTAVDKAESEPDLAFAINRDGAGVVAAAAAEAGAPVIQLSTDYVYDGGKPTPYVEDDPVAPQSVYGRSKLEGERAAAAANPQTIVLRTAWVFAPYGANFVRTMLRLAGEQDRLRVVDDQVGCPTYAPDLAAAILRIAARIDAQGWRTDYAGITHVAGPDALTWCAFARKIVAGSAARGGRSVPVDAITTADYPTPAKRPANSRLATGRLAALFDARLPPLDDALGRCLDGLTSNATAEGGGR
jgi:dTDP-4-dehydrorhamnose reductase